jgi:RNA polymerase sigma factor (sigma-70 family)
MADDPGLPGFDDERFEEAFPRLFDVAMRPAMRILRSVDAAEDVAAETLARVYADWRRLAGAPWVDAWATRVATNLAIDHVRRSKRPLPAVEVAPSGQLEVRMDLAAAVARLPRRQREAVSLRYFADLSEQEVAALMDVSVGSVKTHVHRGLASIRVELGDSWAVPVC